MDDPQIKALLKTTGHWDYPFGEYLPLPDSVDLRSFDGRYRVESLQTFMLPTLQQIVTVAHPNWLSPFPVLDGDVDNPDTMALLETPRCWVPDYGPATVGEAVGAGPWKRCHGVGDFHAVSVYWNDDPPSHLTVPFGNGRTVWEEVLVRVRNAYDEIGLRVWWDGPGSPFKDGKTPHQIQAHWVRSSSGWIGLATIGNNGLACTANQLDCSYLATWNPSSVLEQLVRLIVILLMHEIGHNCGRLHTSGGVMNPNILNLSATWIGDTSEDWMKDRFGGVRVPGDTPPPPPPPPPDGEYDTVVLRSKGKIEVIQGPWV